MNARCTANAAMKRSSRLRCRLSGIQGEARFDASCPLAKNRSSTSRSPRMRRCASTSRAISAACRRTLATRSSVFRISSVSASSVAAAVARVRSTPCNALSACVAASISGACDRDHAFQRPVRKRRAKNSGRICRCRATSSRH